VFSLSLLPRTRFCFLAAFFANCFFLGAAFFFASFFLGALFLLAPFFFVFFLLFFLVAIRGVYHFPSCVFVLTILCSALSPEPSFFSRENNRISSHLRGTLRRPFLSYWAGDPQTLGSTVLPQHLATLSSPATETCAVPRFPD
jgi:hypothetical protein